MGIDEVYLEQKGNLITIAYDASYKCLRDVETIMDQHFRKAASDWWTGIK